MSSPDKSSDTTEFRPDFVEGIIGFLGEQFNSLKPRERAHAVGVVANTLAALAVNQSRAVDASGMATTLDALSDASNDVIGNFVHDESTAYLFPQSSRICEIVREAIAKRQS